MNYYNDITELSSDEINFLLDLAKRLELNPEPSALKGKVLGLLFLNPSLRTMTSFQSAMIRLGEALLLFLRICRYMALRREMV